MWRAACPQQPGRPFTGGFTLIELLVALSVMSVAVSVFIAMYISSLDLASTAHNRLVALNLAEEQLAAITGAPARFVWKIPAGNPEETRFDVELTGEDPKAGNEGGLPGAMPAEPAAFRRQQAEHERFRWRAEAMLQRGGGYYEVTVVVSWEDAARPQFLAVTSAVPAIAVHAPAQAETAEATP
ncbi:MAG: prepilin-type N-terminal cleavage/methylation domain-containing protein [Candidatus Hydrogenedens sp.]|nr:prepilin-type N-terminal cleavage/methylation domain-containing protein [Candidatus Hydrogenedens sp.]